MLTHGYVRCRCLVKIVTNSGLSCQRKIVLATSVNTCLKEDGAVVIFVSSLRQASAIFTDYVGLAMKDIFLFQEQG
jgi:hypothetical protein